MGGYVTVCAAVHGSSRLNMVMGICVCVCVCVWGGEGGGWDGGGGGEEYVPVGQQYRADHVSVW